MPIVRRNHGRGHSYIDSDTGIKLPGVTTITKGGIPKDALVGWAVNATVDHAIDHWDELSALPISERIKRLTKARWGEKERSTARGTHVHRIGERLVGDERVRVPDELADVVQSYVRFLDEWRAEAVSMTVIQPDTLDVGVPQSMVERTVYSAEHRYCGTLDLVADLDDPDDPDGPQIRWLLDLLTSGSGVFGEKGLQVVAYRHAEVWIDDFGGEHPIEDLHIERCGVVWLRPTGYDLVPIEADVAAFRDFLYAKEIARFVAEGRDIIGEPLTPPTASAWRLVRDDDQPAEAEAALAEAVS